LAGQGGRLLHARAAAAAHLHHRTRASPALFSAQHSMHYGVISPGGERHLPRVYRKQRDMLATSAALDPASCRIPAYRYRWTGGYWTVAHAW